MNAVVAVTVSNRDDQRQLARVLETIGGQLVDAVAIDPVFTMAIPAPESQKVTKSAVATAAVLGLFATIVTVTKLVAAWVSPGFGASSAER